MKELGCILGVTDESVRLLEKSKRSPSFEILCALADYFEVSIDYLTGRTDKPEINR
nr:MAG TPA: repressor protein [Caudoviricetes sp.]